MGERKQSAAIIPQTVLKRLTSIAKDPFIRDVIDWRKLANSGFLAEAQNCALVHFAKHGDWTYLQMLVDVAPKGQPAQAMQEWASTATNGKFTPGSVQAKKAQQQRAEELELKQQLDSAIREAQRPKPVSRMRVVLADDKRDLLDSFARLPGSFGSGRKR